MPILSNACNKSPINFAYERESVARRPMITRSYPTAAWVGKISAANARKRRFARLRCTALPTLRLTVNPTRKKPSARAGFPSAGWLLTCRIKPGAAHFLRVDATRRKSGRRFKRKSWCDIDPALSGQALAAFGATGCDDATTAYGCHTATKAMAAFANDVARLVCTFHGVSPLPQIKARCIRGTTRQVNAHCGLYAPFLGAVFCKRSHFCVFVAGTMASGPSY